MDQAIYGTARRIAQGINTVERRGASGIETSVRLMQDMIEARRSLNKEPTFAAATFTSLASATLHFAEGMERLATCHEQLLNLKDREGIDLSGYGDLCPLEGSAIPLRVVV